jgi:hypothetical protein
VLSVGVWSNTTPDRGCAGNGDPQVYCLHAGATRLPGLRSDEERMRLIRLFALLATLTMLGTAAATAQDTTASRPRAPRTPHRTVGKDDCLVCHRQGNPDSITAVPATHDYPVERCLRCHRTADTLPPQSEHVFDDRHAQCRDCHVAGNTENAKPVPATHERYTRPMCVMCHEPHAAG